MRNTTSIAVGT